MSRVWVQVQKPIDFVHWQGRPGFCGRSVGPRRDWIRTVMDGPAPTPTERALRAAVEADPDARAMVVLVDYWAEHGRADWARRARIFALDRPKRCRLLFARVPGTAPHMDAEAELRRRLDESEALFFGQPIEAVTARFEIAWSDGTCRFDQDLRLRLDGSYGIDWLQPHPFLDWLVCGKGLPIALPTDLSLLAKLQSIATRWVSSGCPGHADVDAGWFDDWGSERGRISD